MVNVLTSIIVLEFAKKVGVCILIWVVKKELTRSNSVMESLGHKKITRIIKNYLDDKMQISNGEVFITILGGIYCLDCKLT